MQNFFSVTLSSGALPEHLSQIMKMLSLVFPDRFCGLLKGNLSIEWFPMQCHKTKAKVITVTNRNKRS